MNGLTIDPERHFVVAAIPGSYGKPRPAIVVQADLFAELPSVVVCPLTTTLRDDADQFRITVERYEGTGLLAPSQIAVDKVTVLPRARIGQVIGRADDILMLRVSRSLAVFLGIA